MQTNNPAEGTCILNDKGLRSYESSSKLGMLLNGGELPVRHTRVFHKENDGWKVVHLHVSIAVPDESVGA